MVAGFDERGMPLEPSSALRSTILDGVAKLQGKSVWRSIYSLNAAIYAIITDLKTGDPYFRLERYATFVEVCNNNVCELASN